MTTPASTYGAILAGRDGVDVLVWQLGGDPLPERFVGHGARAASAAFSADGSTLATTAVDRTLITWDVSGSRRSGSVLTRDLVGHASTLWAAGSAYVVGRAGGGLEFVDPKTGAVSGLRGVNPHAGAEAIATARSAPRSDRLIVADQDHTTIW